MSYLYLLNELIFSQLYGEWLYIFRFLDEWNKRKSLALRKSFF